MILTFGHLGILTVRWPRRPPAKKGEQASPTWRRGHRIGFRIWAEVPVSLRYQRYQFTQITGEFRARSFRSGLRVKPPRDLDDCRSQLKQLANSIYIRNGSVDVDDLVQIGEVAILEQERDWERRGIQPRPKAWEQMFENAQKAMFDAIDQHSVALGSEHAHRADEGGSYEMQDVAARLCEAGLSSKRLRRQYARLEQTFSIWDQAESDWFQNVPGAACNWTVYRRGHDWELFEDVEESWTTPLPPGSCRPRKALHCEDPRHSPLVDKFWGGESLRTFDVRPAHPPGERFCVFRPHSCEELIELYRRAWGPWWDPTLIGLSPAEAVSGCGIRQKTNLPSRIITRGRGADA